MATLRLFWDDRYHDMWSWSTEGSHLDARMMKRLKNNVYTAHLGPRGAQPTTVVVAKMARGPQEMHALSREAECYRNELLHLQGIIVPRFYGCFKGKSDGRDIGCLLLEYCTGYIPLTEQEIVESNRAKILAVCKIHDVGLKHGDLGRGNHHFVRMGDSVRIIDFSLAVRHKCANAYPVVTNSRSHGEYVHQCDELALIERTCGYRTDAAAEQGYYRIPHYDS